MPRTDASRGLSRHRVDGLYTRGQRGNECVDLSHGGRSPLMRFDKDLCIDRGGQNELLAGSNLRRQRSSGCDVVHIPTVEHSDQDAGVKNSQRHSLRSCSRRPGL